MVFCDMEVRIEEKNIHEILNSDNSTPEAILWVRIDLMQLTIKCVDGGISRKIQRGKKCLWELILVIIVN